MNIFNDIHQLPVFNNPVVTIGTFDGVHKGHKKIIAQLKQEAQERNDETVIITFKQHPRNVVASNNPVQLLNTLEEKTALLQKENIDHLIVVDFNETFSEQSAEAYIQDFLVNKIHPSCIIIGYDHKFGKHRSGDYRMLEEYGRKSGFDVKEINAETVKHVTVSSTKIRNAILNNDIHSANDLLGYKYFFTGKVVEGNKLGRTIGFPTANLQTETETKLVPGNGVYAVNAFINKDFTRSFKGMMNIGVRPTVDGSRRTIEVNIFDFDDDIYDENLTVEVIAFLRPEQKFSGIEALKEQLSRDKEEAKNI